MDFYAVQFDMKLMNYFGVLTRNFKLFKRGSSVAILSTLTRSKLSACTQNSLMLDFGVSCTLL